MDKKYLKLLDEGWELGSDTFSELGLENAEKLRAKGHLRATILACIVRPQRPGKASSKRY
jgi:hypothetical protein